MELRFLHLRRPYCFEAPFAGEFVLLVDVADATVTLAEQVALARSIAESKCRYVLCRGFGCEELHDRVDDALIERELADPTCPFVMTTWHADEPLADTLAYMRTCTAFADFAPAAFAIVALGDDGRALDQARALLTRPGGVGL